MSNYKVIRIQDKPTLKDAAALWFHQKWNVSEEAYLESMEECITMKNAVPQWYVVVHNTKIIGGIGVIKNDFHNRKDLSPNVCALYVEEEYRKQGIAGTLLNFVSDDMSKLGINILYLITDHTDFYEKYGWEYLCMVESDEESLMSRIYIHRL